MDDTSRRVGPTPADRPAAEQMTGRSDESVQGYGVTGEYEPSASDADTGEDDRTTAAIRRDIEHTREEMSETIDAIQEKLRPANIVSSATETIKDATTERVRQMTHAAGETASNLMSRGREESRGLVDTIRDNPVPAALIGIGAAWLFMHKRSSDHDDYGYSTSRWANRPDSAAGYTSGSGRVDTGSGYDPDYSRTGYPRSRSAYSSYRGSSSSGMSQGIVDRVKDNPIPAALAGIGLGWLAMSGNDGDDYDGYNDRSYGNRASAYADETDSMTSQVSDTVSDAASGVADAAQQVTARTQEMAQDATRRVKQGGRRAQSELQRMTRENPLAVGAGALLLGAIVGLAVPETERENEMLGEARDSMIDKAQDMARTATSRAQEAATDLVSDAASRIVGGQGNT